MYNEEEDKRQTRASQLINVVPHVVLSDFLEFYAAKLEGKLILITVLAFGCTFFFVFSFSLLTVCRAMNLYHWVVA